MPRIRLYINTGFAGCKHVDHFDYDDDEWKAMTPAEQEEKLNELAQAHLFSYIDYGAYVED